MGQQSRIGKVATSVFTSPEDGLTRVVYHSTPVVTWGKGVITLRTEGWFTSTTKTRMNQASRQFNLGFSVFQKDRKWFAEYRGKIVPFAGDTLQLGEADDR